MKNQLQTSPIFVALGSEIDFFRFPQISTNAKIEELGKRNELIYHQVDDLKAASMLCKEFIKEHRLGSSNWMGGRVVDENYNFVAQVSYNGRVWDNEDWEISKEIEIC
ncbi:hypothetical protein [Tamlana crocina]|uniref:Uncharacterized protein n=1 Tax=Tamlana crocina TaxID=393006 RepID=A0ABX1DB42_9FLAO|nr:hypothetical protein [Tamlana crocina]NJX15282.1 hypothetical protein [Tamlana crocina]